MNDKNMTSTIINAFHSTFSESSKDDPEQDDIQRIAEFALSRQQRRIWSIPIRTNLSNEHRYLTAVLS